MSTAPPVAVAVVGGRGKTGLALAASLGRRARVVVLGRAEWPRLREALGGCRAAYVIAPNFHPDEPAYVADVLDAAAVAGVRRVVYHSVASPYLPAVPHHLAKAEAEDVVRRSPLEWTVLQPCAYVQNLLPGLRGEAPAIRVPYDVDRPHGLVDLADVADCAATVLLDDGHLGATYEIAGPLVTLREAAAAAADVLEHPVDVERLDPDDWERGAGAGLPAPERAGLRAMFDYYDAHGFLAGSRVAHLLLGRPAHDVAGVLARELAQPAAGQATGPREE